MKRILGIAAVTGLLAAAPAFAGVDVFFQFGPPAPVAFAPAPAYMAPAHYYGPRWYERHERFERHHFYHPDYRDRRFYHDRY